MSGKGKNKTELLADVAFLEESNADLMAHCHAIERDLAIEIKMAKGYKAMYEMQLDRSLRGAFTSTVDNDLGNFVELADTSKEN